MVTSTGGRYIDSLVKLGERIIILLNIEKIFTEEEHIGIKDAAAAAQEASFRAGMSQNAGGQ